MLYITVPDMNDSISKLSIDGKEYGLRFTYNEKHDYWNFGLYDGNNVPIIAGVKIVPNFPLLHFFSGTDLPDGVFGCVSKMETVGRHAFKNKSAEFVYLPNAELEDD